MGETSTAPRHLAVFEAEDSANHRDGRLREDTAGVVLLTTVPILVRIFLKFVTLSDILRFKQVAYVDASSVASIKADLQAWSRALGDGHERDEWEDAVRVLSSSPRDEQWGLILDNADDPHLNLVPFMSKNINLTVIITSRNRNLGNLSTTTHVELGEMAPNEALATLLQAARRQLPLPVEEMASAQTLLKELGYLAVAVVQAGTYCHALSFSFTQYWSLFKSHRADLMKRAEPSSLDNYERGAYTTLDISYKALPQAARKFLHFISFFHHTDIPLAALTAAAECNFRDGWPFIPRPADHTGITAELEELLCVNGIRSEMRVQDTLRTLQSFSLLSITSIGESVFLQVHPLIQAWSRDMDPSSAWHYRAMAAQIISSCSSDEAFKVYRHLIGHIFEMMDQLKMEELHINDLMAAGIILYRQGRYQAAAGVFGSALETTRKPSGRDERSTSSISLWLAEVYRAQGLWSEAEKLQVEGLEQQRRILGMEHPDTIRAAASLASTYLAQGRSSEAEKLEVDVLERQRRLLGMEHPSTIRAAANLAWTYHAQGRSSDAEKLEVDVLERRRRILGMEHPDTIRAAANLAVTYLAQGRSSEAEKLQVDVLEQQRRILGMEHPDTITAAANLAGTYRAQGRWSEAEKLEVDVLEQRRRILGMEHPDTITAAANLAATYGKQSRWDEDTALLVPAVELCLKVLGQQHPHTQTHLRSLAFVYSKLGKAEEAQEIQDLLIS
jgi:tetratricopeptide (TPR) repeat protein